MFILIVIILAIALATKFGQPKPSTNTLSEDVFTRTQVIDVLRDIQEGRVSVQTALDTFKNVDTTQPPLKQKHLIDIHEHGALPIHHSPPLSQADILMYVGAFFIVIAGAIFVSASWGALSPISLYLWFTAYMVLFSIAGVVAYQRYHLTMPGIVFNGISHILLPLNALAFSTLVVRDTSLSSFVWVVFSLIGIAYAWYSHSVFQKKDYIYVGLLQGLSATIGMFYVHHSFSPFLSIGGMLYALFVQGLHVIWKEKFTNTQQTVVNTLSMYAHSIFFLWGYGSFLYKQETIFSWYHFFLWICFGSFWVLREYTQQRSDNHTYAVYASIFGALGTITGIAIHPDSLLFWYGILLVVGITYILVDHLIDAQILRKVPLGTLSLVLISCIGVMTIMKYLLDPHHPSWLVAIGPTLFAMALSAYKWLQTNRVQYSAVTLMHWYLIIVSCIPLLDGNKPVLTLLSMGGVVSVYGIYLRLYKTLSTIPNYIHILHGALIALFWVMTPHIQTYDILLSLVICFATGILFAYNTKRINPWVVLGTYLLPVMTGFAYMHLEQLSAMVYVASMLMLPYVAISLFLRNTYPALKSLGDITVLIMTSLLIAGSFTFAMEGTRYAASHMWLYTLLLIFALGVAWHEYNLTHEHKYIQLIPITLLFPVLTALSLGDILTSHSLFTSIGILLLVEYHLGQYLQGIDHNPLHDLGTYGIGIVGGATLFLPTVSPLIFIQTLLVFVYAYTLQLHNKHGVTTAMWLLVLAVLRYSAPLLWSLPTWATFGITGIAILAVGTYLYHRKKL